MAFTSVTNTFSNGTTADATQVNTNFTDLVNGLKDTTKDLSVAAITAGGNVSFNGGTFIFNEAGADLDFRIEGDLGANLFQTDASSDRVGINIAIPEEDLHVGAQTGNAEIGLGPVGGNGHFVMTFNGTNGIATIENENSANGSIAMKTNGTECVRLDGPNGRVGIKTPSPLATLDVRGSALFNENGAAVDFRIEGDTETHLFFLDGSADFIGIGASAPGSFLHAQRDTTANDFRLDMFAATDSIVNAVTFRKGHSNTRGTWADTNGGVIVGGLQFFGSHSSIPTTIGGKYYYITDGGANGASTTGIHKWETPTTNGIPSTVKMQLDTRGTFVLGNTDTGSLSEVGTMIFTNAGTVPAGGTANASKLYAEDVAAKSELRAMDEDGNVTTITPHNFSLIPGGRSEDMAWAYYSKRGNKEVNVDMMKMARMLETMTGEKLIYKRGWK